ncbi:MAG: ion transporter, partial [Odoribacteraceae bacterium]|nr:ion transporter [Odoribacteraceae bacterium]
MRSIKNLCERLAGARWFELSIVGIIIVNCFLIGVETYGHHAGVQLVQTVILACFTFEITVRFIASRGVKAFFLSGWNNFDLFLVLISYIPESLFTDASTVMVLRVLRVFRVLRLLRTSDEIKLT